MKKLFGFVALMSLTACGGMSFRAPMMGSLYSGQEFGDAATSNPAGTKMGEACSMSILGAVALGDASIEAARKNGGITSITSVDGKFTNYVGVYAQYCTIVRGK